MCVGGCLSFTCLPQKCINCKEIKTQCVKKKKKKKQYYLSSLKSVYLETHQTISSCFIMTIKQKIRLQSLPEPTLVPAVEMFASGGNSSEPVCEGVLVWGGVRAEETCEERDLCVIRQLEKRVKKKGICKE